MSQIEQATTLEADITGLGPKPMPYAPPSFLIKVVFGLRRFFLKLADLTVPADLAVFERCSGIGHTQILGVLARLNVADILNEYGPLTSEELASKTDMNEDAMHRVMRAVITSGIFKLDNDGRFSNNRLSRTLLSGNVGRVKEFAEYFSSKSNSRSYLEMDHILSTGEDGFDYFHKKDLWEWFDQHPGERETFAQMMMGVTFSEAPMVAKLYPFEELSSLCDVGGGRGALVSELAIRYPHLQCALFDCEGVVNSAKPLLRARKVEGRVDTVVGDFFDRIVPGYDAYLFKNVMHDWDNDRCITILKNCRNVMKAGDKVLLVELILEKHDRTNFGAFRDVHVMTVCTGGRERSREDFKKLLNASGFNMTRVFHSPIISVIEGVAEAS